MGQATRSRVRKPVAAKKPSANKGAASKVKKNFDIVKEEAGDLELDLNYKQKATTTNVKKGVEYKDEEKVGGDGKLEVKRTKERINRPFGDEDSS